MKGFHLDDEYFKGKNQVFANCMQGNAIFPEILTTAEAIKSGESLFATDFYVISFQDRGVNFYKRIATLSDYPQPIITVDRQHESYKNHGREMWITCCDEVMSYYPPNSVPDAHWWWQLNPSVHGWTQEDLPYYARPIQTAFIGRCAYKKRPNIAATILKYYGGVACVNSCGPAGIPLYNLAKDGVITLFRNAPRDQMAEVLKQTRFLLVPTDFGESEIHSLENVMVEGLFFGCALILHKNWCSGRFKNYPLQVKSPKYCLDELPELTIQMFQECREFMEGELEYHTRTPQQLRDHLFNTKCVIKPERRENMRLLAARLKEGIWKYI